MITRDQMPWAEKPMMRTGHYAFRIVLPVCVAAFIARDALGNPQGSVSFLFDSISACWCWAVWCEIRVHSRHLCERCAAKTPLDPQRAITRWRLALLGYHRGVLQAAFIAVLSWIALTAILFRGPQWPYWADLADIGIQVFIATVILFSWKHSRLQPWCPYCRWGDGGEPETVPGPDPDLELT